MTNIQTYSKWSCLLVITCLLSFTLPARAHPPAIEKLAEGYLKQNQTTDPAILLIATVDGKQQQISIFGSGRTQVKSDTIFPLGALSSVFTTALLPALIHESKQIHLATPLQALLGQADSVPAYQGQPLLLSHLATHSATLPEYPSNLLPEAQAMATFHAERYSQEDLWSALRQYHPTGTFGKQVNYSHMGIAVLGQALAEWKHTTYLGLLQQTILNPLHLNNTGVILSPQQTMQQLSLSGKADYLVNALTLAPALGLKASVPDLLAFLAAHLGQSGTALDAILDFGHQPRLTVKENTAMALGWYVSQEREKKRIRVWQHSAIPGAISFMGFEPDQQRGVLILANTDKPVSELGLALMQASHPAPQSPHSAPSAHPSQQP